HLASGSTAPHHHTRLNISYDANFYGANIPLGYQYQVYSANYYKSNYLGLPDFFLSTFLYATVNQKTFRELVGRHTVTIFFSFPYKKSATRSPPTTGGDRIS
ncbi:hypothetical protein, partial [Fluviicola sp.]|uniref:hypothetical protein n=1 Tax=Fluviicola sp. TaxID=1917219 RepID=UPI0028170B88